MKSVVFSVLFQLLAAGALLYARTLVQAGWLRTLTLALAIGNLASVPFAFIVLWQRIREIEKGELEEARKY